MEEDQRENDSNKMTTTQEANQEPMDATDPGQGQERPSEQLSNLTPRSPSGRQRKKNPKFLDYETDTPSPQQKQPKKSPVKKSSVEGETSGKSPAKRGRRKKAVEPKADGDQEATDKTAHESVGETSQETPKKTLGAKKTPAKKIPAKKKPAIEDDLATAEGGGTDAEKQEKETPKPKRKYERRKQVIQEVVPAETPAFRENQGETPIEPREDDIVPVGRPRRGAAIAALKYLHSLAKEALDPNEELGSQQEASSGRPKPDLGRGQKGPKARSRGQKRKRPDFDSDAAEDEDFVPDVENEEDEDMEEAQDEDFDSDFEAAGKSAAASLNRSIQGQVKRWGKASNGLHNNIMNPVWECAEINKKFREEHCSSWVFPEWVPSVNYWHRVPHSDLEKYLPQELQSAAFKVSRDGLSKEEMPLQRLNRFEAVAAHPQRWDMSLYAGGPVWAIEWCPSPDGATATQYVALACHRGMDDQHFANKTYTGPGLIQLWDLGKLEYNSKPESQPALAYGLAQDKGFVWQLKWCPAGAWELPSCSRKAPFLPRLGLLAAATSIGVVTIYSLPHPDALLSTKKLHDTGEASHLPLIYQAEGVATLKLGSFKAPHHERSGQVMSMDWLPDKPHNIMAIGFYDGIVGLWDLSTKSSLLRLRDPDRSLTLLPYRCFLAHDNAVRALAFCPTSRYLLATAGDDRMMKTWDLKKIYEPIITQKRHLTTEVYWPLRSSGLFLSDENTYATQGLHGVHYYDMGYQNIRPVFLVPRTGTMWSMSLTDWLNSLVTSDTLGEVMLALLPRMNNNPQYLKRTIERRFPLYFTDMVPYNANTTEEENQEVEGSKQGGGELEGAEGEKDDRRGGEDEGLPQPAQTYSEAAKKYYLHYSDNDVLNFKNYQMRAPWKRMQATEVKTKINMDIMPMAALHKVRFNPNMSCHTWVVSGGQAGLVRIHCLRALHNSNIQKIISENQAQFTALYSPEDQREAIHTSTHPL